MGAGAADRGEPAALGNGFDGTLRGSGGVPWVHPWVWKAFSGPLRPTRTPSGSQMADRGCMTTLEGSKCRDRRRDGAHVAAPASHSTGAAAAQRRVRPAPVREPLDELEYGQARLATATQLRDHQGRGSAVAIFEDLQQCQTSPCVERGSRAKSMISVLAGQERRKGRAAGPSIAPEPPRRLDALQLGKIKRANRLQLLCGRGLLGDCRAGCRAMLDTHPGGRAGCVPHPASAAVGTCGRAACGTARGAALPCGALDSAVVGPR